MKFWYTSDTHFNHPFVAKLRGFTKPIVDEGGEVGDSCTHDETIIENWNRHVNWDDMGFILGDFAMNWKGVEEKLRRMNGRKILITGNHDIMFPANRAAHKYQARYIGPGGFEAIQAYAYRRTGNREFLMSHFPYSGEGQRDIPDRYTQFRLKDEGMWLLHGHTHSSEKLGPYVLPISVFNSPPVYRGRQLHVGLDAWGLNPVTEQEVVGMMMEADSRLNVDLDDPKDSVDSQLNL